MLKVKEEPFVNNRYYQIVDKVRRILFVQSKDINYLAPDLPAQDEDGKSHSNSYDALSGCNGIGRTERKSFRFMCFQIQKSS